MFDLSTLTLFIITALVLLITPGPAVLYIIARSVDQGRLAGIVSTLGIGVGTLVHVIAAALGISVILVSSALAFNIVKYLGAACLIYLGICKLMERDQPQQATEAPAQSLSRIFSQGIVVNILNPKTALFFFAFLPQFVNVEQGSIAWQIMLLGMIFVVLGVFSDGLYALLAGSLGHWLRGNLNFLRGQRYFAGTAFIALGEKEL